MSEIPKDYSDNVVEDSNLLELANSSAEGWSTNDLKQVLSSAQTLKSQKSVASIKAVAKLAFLAKQCNNRQESLVELLFSLNPATKLVRQNSKYIVVEVAANFRVPRIPLGYGFKGGVARIALLNVIGCNTQRLNARDFDLVRFSKGNIEQDQSIAARVMAEDYSHGHGVEVVDSLDKYFESRDLTINEILFFGKKVAFTRNALDDLRQRVLKPSKFLIDNNPEIPGKIACKILRLAAEFQVSGAGFKLLDFPNELKVATRDFEMHRQRAAELGANIEKQYIELCGEFLDIESLRKPIKSVSACGKTTQKQRKIGINAGYSKLKFGLKRKI